jgi:hypothetical protein
MKTMGEVRDFRQPPDPKKAQQSVEIRQARPADPLQILDRNSPVQPTQVDLRVHAEEVREQDKLRYTPSKDGIEIRLRESDQKKWDKVKRLQDE